MFEKLEYVEKRFEEINELVTDPLVISDNNKYKALMREYKSTSSLVEKYRELKMSRIAFEEAKGMLDAGGLDKDFKEMVQEEYEENKEKVARFSEELRVLLLPQDPNDNKNVIIEIRGGAGGDEAALFAHSLYRMYTMYGEAKGFKTDLLNMNGTERGGVKEVSFSIEGENAYSKLKYESGVHRVQRVPETESSGRIHTSTVTVAVLPEAEEVEVEINTVDLQIDTFRSSGAGGQHVNTTDSAIRITHIPTGIVVECQDERSQYKNKDKAMKVLRSKIYEGMMNEQNAKIASERKSQVGTGDRSERIRTYNFPQGRVTDHRIGLTLYKLEAIMNGDLDELIQSLTTYDQAEKLKLAGEESRN